VNRLIQKRRNAVVRSASLKLLEDILVQRESPSPELKAKQERLLAILAARRRLL
jgi:hypothetical protein